MEKRDASPNRKLAPTTETTPKGTEFHLVRRIKGVWKVYGGIVLPGQWHHFKTEFSGRLLKRKGILFDEFRKGLESRLKDVPYYTTIFEYDIVAPSDLILVIWVGLHKPKHSLTKHRTMEGFYTSDYVHWPTDMSEEQYKKSQAY